MWEAEPASQGCFLPDDHRAPSLESVVHALPSAPGGESDLDAQFGQGTAGALHVPPDRLLGGFGFVTVECEDRPSGPNDLHLEQCMPPGADPRDSEGREPEALRHEVGLERPLRDPDGRPWAHALGPHDREPQETSRQGAPLTRDPRVPSGRSCKDAPRPVSTGLHRRVRRKPPLPEGAYQSQFAQRGSSNAALVMAWGARFS